MHDRGSGTEGKGRRLIVKNMSCHGDLFDGDFMEGKGAITRTYGINKKEHIS